MVVLGHREVITGEDVFILTKLTKLVLFMQKQRKNKIDLRNDSLIKTFVIDLLDTCTALMIYYSICFMFSHCLFVLFRLLISFSSLRLKVRFSTLSFQLIVAVEPEEIPRLENLYKRGQENNVRDLKMIGPEQIKDIESNCVVSNTHCLLRPCHS